MFKTIKVFTEAIDVIREYNPEALLECNPDIIGEIEHFNDFESFQFIVIDNKNVITIDSISGDVIENESINDFISNNIDYAKLNLKENYV